VHGLAVRATAVGKGVLVGYLAAAIIGISAVVFVSAAAYAANASSFEVGLGPLPLMSYWHTADGWGFNSDWGLAALTPLGAVAGLWYAMRNRSTTAA
jgi:hypothetical protein